MSLTNKLYKSRNTILDMLELRGYDVSQYRNYSINEIDIMNRNMPLKVGPNMESLDLMITNKETGNKVYLKYVLNSKIRVQAITNIIRDIVPAFDIDEVLEVENPNEITDMLSPGDELIIIIRDKLSNTEILDNYLKKYYLSNKIFVQFFWIDSLQIKIIDHDFVPDHRIISEIEKQQLLVTYNLTNYSQLPLVLHTDPIAKFYGMRIGDVCEITRSSETAGQYVCYRYCQ